MSDASRNSKPPSMYRAIYRRLVPHALRKPIRKVIRGRRSTAAVEMPSWVGEIGHAGPGIDQLLESAPSQANSPRILIFSAIPWPQGCVEHLLATALKLRGYEVSSVVCGGVLPDCEMHYYDFDRPDCSSCLARARGYMGPFGIDPILTTDYLTDEDVAEARELTLKRSEQELQAIEYAGVPIGKIARFHVNVFYQTFLPSLDPKQLNQFRTFCQSAILMTKASGRILDDLKPTIAVVSNGKAFSYRPFFISAKSRGIRVVTWEEHAFDNTTKFVFNHDSYAGEIHLERAWPELRNVPLTAEQDARLDAYFSRWRQSENTPFAYYKGKANHHASRASIGIPQGKPLVICLPNMVRDTAAFDRDIAFENLMDWVLQVAAYASRRPDVHFVIRAHPAERVLPPQYAKYNRFFVCEEVRKNVFPLPSNLQLLEGDSEISSYSLIELADVIIVYTSTLGLECAMAGRLAHIAGDTHYRNKGFTREISTPDELWAVLDSGPPYQRTIEPEWVSLARRYAYIWRFRHPVEMPFYDTEAKAFDLSDLRELGPGGNPIVDALCQRIISGQEFIDIDSRPQAGATQVGVSGN